MKGYNVWMEGYSATGNYAPARFVGSATASSFRNACVELLQDDQYFDEAALTVWGCRLYDNEADARKSFG